MKSFLEDGLHYNELANSAFIGLRGKAGVSSDEAMRSLLSHIINAQALWLDRIHGQPLRFSVWQVHSYEELAELNESLKWDTFKVLDQGELEREVPYTTSKGEAYKSTIGAILHHLLLHGAYHRGQIATMLRQQGVDPPFTDYIHYRRLGGVLSK